MWAQFANVLNGAKRALGIGLYGPQALAFLPAFVLAAFWIGGEPFLIATALGLPVLFLVSVERQRPDNVSVGSDLGDVIGKDVAAKLAGQTLKRAREAGGATACILLELDGLEQMATRAGNATVESLRKLTLSRIRGALRPKDIAVRLSDNRFGVFLAPSHRLDLEAALQMCARLQNKVEEPATIDETARYLSASIGLCVSSRIETTAKGNDFFDYALTALAEADANRPSAIRAWSTGMQNAHAFHLTLLEDVEKALQNGQIQPWFQPQICTSTGRITGVEALSRWIHPDRGVIPPAQFLRCLKEAGLMGRLSEVVLVHCLTALRGWDRAGLNIPRVSMNLSDPELRDPKLVDKISWELDRFGLTPARFGIEILETVVADSPDGVVARNISELSELGCLVDLDDFGTGHASIASLRRFKVNRLKIDRSFVTRVDRDEEQRRMLAAVLGLADRLDLQTVAEGVETVGEHALLAQLGCDHVQGFGIARPMPVDQINTWAQEHEARIAEAQKLGRDAS